jgi:hypothetical protein
MVFKWHARLPRSRLSFLLVLVLVRVWWLWFRGGARQGQYYLLGGTPGGGWSEVTSADALGANCPCLLGPAGRVAGVGHRAAVPRGVLRWAGIVKQLRGYGILQYYIRFYNDRQYYIILSNIIVYYYTIFLQ